MANIRSLVILLLATTASLLSGGCVFTNNTAKLGKYTCRYEIVAIGMAEDGSVIVTCVSHSKRCVTSTDSQHVDHPDKTRFVRLSAERIEKYVRSIQRSQEEHPEEAWKSTWYDGLPIVRYYYAGKEDVYPVDPKGKTAEDSLPPAYRNRVPLELFQGAQGAADEARRDGEEAARAKGYADDDPKFQWWADIYTWTRLEKRTSSLPEYRVFYQHGDVSCWLVFRYRDEYLREDLEKPGSGVARVLLFVPAVVGDIVMAPVWYYMLGKSLEKARIGP